MRKPGRLLGGIIITLLIMLSSIGMNTGLAAATSDNNYEIGSGSKIYQLDQLLSDYKTSSAHYRHSLLSYEISQYDSVLAGESYSSVSSQYSNAVDKRAQLLTAQKLYQDYLASTTDPATIAEINSQLNAIAEQIEQYNSNIASLQVSRAEADLQQHVEQFYKDDMTLLKKEAENKLTNDFLKKSYKLMLLQEQQGCYEAYQKYLDTQKAVDKIKCDKGLISKAELELSSSNLDKSSIDVKQNSNSFQSTFTSLQNESGIDSNTKIVLPLSISKKEYDVNKLTTSFETNNTNLLQLAQLKACYQDYQYNYYGTYALYQQISLKVQDYQLQYDALKSDIDSYVKDTVTAYQKAWQEYELATGEMKTSETNYNIICMKRKHKIATQLDEEKAEYEMKASIVSFYQSVYNIIIWQNILDNNIYGDAP